MPNFGILMFFELACRLAIQFSAPSRARALVWFSCCVHPCKHEVSPEALQVGDICTCVSSRTNTGVQERFYQADCKARQIF